MYIAFDIIVLVYHLISFPKLNLFGLKLNIKVAFIYDFHQNQICGISPFLLNKLKLKNCTMYNNLKNACSALFPPWISIALYNHKLITIICRPIPVYVTIIATVKNKYFTCCTTRFELTTVCLFLVWYLLKNLMFIYGQVFGLPKFMCQLSYNVFLNSKKSYIHVDINILMILSENTFLIL